MEKRNTKLQLGIVLGASAILSTAYVVGGGSSNGAGNGKQASFKGGNGGVRGGVVGNGIVSDGGGGVKNGIASKGGSGTRGGRQDGRE